MSNTLNYINVKVIFYGRAKKNWVVKYEQNLIFILDVIYFN